MPSENTCQQLKNFSRVFGMPFNFSHIFRIMSQQLGNEVERQGNKSTTSRTAISLQHYGTTLRYMIARHIIIQTYPIQTTRYRFASLANNQQTLTGSTAAEACTTLSRQVLTTGNTRRLHSAHCVTSELNLSIRLAFMSCIFWGGREEGEGRREEEGEGEKRRWRK